MSDCAGCGRCCTELKLEIMEIDLIREPILRNYALKMDDYEGDPSNPLDQAYILPNPCPLLINNRCAIYKSRPNLCVAYGDKCLSGLNKQEV